MIKTCEHIKLAFDYRTGKYNKKISQIKRTQIDVICDKCGIEFTERYSIFQHRFNLIGLEYCSNCSRPIVCRLAWYKGNHNTDGSYKPNGGNFSTERWNKLSKEEQFMKTSKASKALHTKLNSNPEKKNEHYQKVFKHSAIGYISKGQREIYDILKNDGYILDGLVSGMKVDIVNIDKKIAIEYNGDMWHCNPRKWKPEQYNTAIKMTASEKWKLDRNRRFSLRKLGYDVHIIWESEWTTDRTKVYNLLKKISDTNYEFEPWQYKPSMPLKGRSFEEIYGKERADVVKHNMSVRMEGKKLKTKPWKVTLPDGRVFYVQRLCDWKSINTGVHSARIKYEKIEYSDDLIFWDGISINLKTPVYCPHCNKVSSSASNMTRYHFDNCKNKK